MLYQTIMDTKSRQLYKYTTRLRVYVVRQNGKGMRSLQYKNDLAVLTTLRLVRRLHRGVRRHQRIPQLAHSLVT